MGNFYQLCEYSNVESKLIRQVFYNSGVVYTKCGRELPSPPDLEIAGVFQFRCYPVTQLHLVSNVTSLLAGNATGQPYGARWLSLLSVSVSQLSYPQ